MSEMTDERALELLETLIKVPGRLRQITFTHKCMGTTCTEAMANSANGKGFPSTDQEKLACDMYCAAYSDVSYSNPLADPSHFFIHDIIGIKTNVEGFNNKEGLVEAYTAEGDRCVGYPAAVLKRVTQAVNVF